MAWRLAMCTALLATVAISACGGGATTAPSASAGTATGGTRSPAATPAGGGATAGPAASVAAGSGGASPGPAATVAAGGPPGDPCALLTVAEAAGAMGTNPLSAASKSGDPATCRFTLADGEEALTIDILRSGAAAQYQAFIDNGSAEEVSGVGDAALYERGTRRLVFQAVGLLVYVFPRYVGGADAALAAATAMGKIIASRLTTGSVPPALQITAPPVLSADAACDLLSVDEAAAILNQGPMSMQANEFAQQFCTYAVASTGEVVLSTYFQAKGGAASWLGFTGSLTTDPVSGLGDKALFEPSTGILFVLKGDTMLNANVFGQEPAKTLELDRKLAEVMLGHL